jgi:hypothetical protein
LAISSSISEKFSIEPLVKSSIKGTNINFPKKKTKSFGLKKHREV